MEEVWKDVSGFEGYYQISNRGVLKSLDRVIISSGGRNKPQALHKRRGVILRPSTSGDGYPVVSLNRDGKSTYKKSID